MNAIVPASAGPAVFDFEGLAVKIFNCSGDPEFILADVCRALEIAQPASAARALEEDEKGVRIMHTLGGAQKVTVINESGLYSLIMTSRKPAAKRFKKWVTAEVLPAIRQTGGYMVAAPEESDAELALRAMTMLQATIQRQRAQIAAVEARADAAEESARESEAALENIAGTEGAHCLRDAGKIVGMTQTAFIKFLIARHWIYRTGTDRLSACAARVASGALEMKTVTYPGRGGQLRSSQQVLVTSRGLVLLAKMLKKISGD